MNVPTQPQSNYIYNMIIYLFVKSYYATIDHLKFVNIMHTIDRMDGTKRTYKKFIAKITLRTQTGEFTHQKQRTQGLNQFLQYTSEINTGAE